MELSEIIHILESAPRLGSSLDDPEGTRYIQMSETFLQQILGRLKRIQADLCEEDIVFSKPVDVKAFLYNAFHVCECMEFDPIIQDLCKFFDWIDQDYPVSYDLLFASEGVYYLFTATCEIAGLIEHGVSVRCPSLTQQGEYLYHALKRFSLDEIKDARGEAYDGCLYYSLQIEHLDSGESVTENKSSTKMV